MFHTVYYGNSLGDWLISFLILAFALVLNEIIRYVCSRIVKKTKIQFDNRLYISLQKPVTYGIILLAFRVAAGRLMLEVGLREIITQSCRVLIILNITWFAARFVLTLVEKYFDRQNKKQWENRSFDAHFSPLIKRGLLILIWFAGIVTALNNIGVNVTTLWGTLGIGGIAFALAAQDTIKNLFGGITIYTDRMFHVGDTIKFDTIEGTVEDIGLRRTRIRLYNKRVVTVSNARLMDAVITNVSSESSHRVEVTLGLTYDTTFEQMQHAIDLLHTLHKTIPEVNKTDFVAIFSEFGDSALLITLIYFVHKAAPFREVISKVNFEILRMFGEAGLDFAFPSQTIYMANSPIERSEAIQTKQLH
jgi:MscS family membrane protein